MALADIDHGAVALQDVTAGYAAFRPPRRMSVSEGARQNLYFKTLGGAQGPWDSSITPYMVEPMDMLASRRHEAVVFVGPARTGKTAGLLLGWMAHIVVNDPGDLLFIQMSQDKARDFSKTDIDRALANSDALDALLSHSRHDDNTHDKKFRHGMWMKIGWPTANNVASSTYRYVAITDLDRIANAENVDGEGPLFDLARKRTTTFMSRGMTLVESSPGIEIADPNWRAATPHEGPPVTGVVGIYNRGDRRRWYWKCPHCAEWFEAKPGLELFNLPPDDILLEMVREADLQMLAAEYNRVVCPHCACHIEPRAKQAMNQGGRWVRDGQSLTSDDELIGTPYDSTIVSYWLGGVAAGYQDWFRIILRYLQGLRDYALTGSEETLKATINTDQGIPYMSRLLSMARMNAADPAGRKDASLQRYVVPEAARFITAAVDVQGGSDARFVVQVHAVGPHMEQWPIDRYEIKESAREGMGSAFAPIDPAVYPEDWDVLTERVLRSTYRTMLDGKELPVKMMAIDTGGEHKQKNDGVTDKAYAYYRRMRAAGYAERVMLVKGASAKEAPLIKMSLVGGRNPKEKGDVPLFLLNTNKLKDAVAAGLKRTAPGPGYIHMPGWLPATFFDELKSEIRHKDGKWMQIRKRNEAFDLSVYNRAACLRLSADKINWHAPPTWALPIAQNSDLISREERRAMQDNTVVAAIPDERPPLPPPTAPPLRARRSSRPNLG
jgi:phage terminase large subunit GpA-like protein